MSTLPPSQSGGHHLSHASSAQGIESVDVSTLMLIVVGAHLRAEISDRPLAYRLRERILRWQDQRAAASAETSLRLEPVVCSDVWYLNARELAARPTVAIGSPGVNAASAYFSTRLPTAFVIEHSLRIHADLDFIDAQACMWGINASATGSAIDVFVERYLEAFMHAAE